MNPPEPQSIDIEVISDFACPWCFVGHRRLRRALALRPELQARVRWSPFQLNPDMPREGRNRRAYYIDKFGPERLRQLQESLRLAGEEEGIAFCDTADAIAPNTLSAHVLMHRAAERAHLDVDALAEALFTAHHVRCENLGDTELLVRLAGDLGWQEPDLAAELTARGNEDEVRARVQQSTARGITGVPFFVLGDRYGISGAQPAEALAAAFDEISDPQRDD